MSGREQAVLRSALETCRRYAEYGSGGSTCLAASIPAVESIVSIESDPVFASTVQQLCPRATVRWIDLGVISGYGHPRDESHRYAWPTYSNQELETPDLVLVDGRFRVACICNTLLRYPNAVLLVHDFTGRPEYHSVLQIADVLETVDTLVRLRRKPQAEDATIQALYEAYQFEQA